MKYSIVTILLLVLCSSQLLLGGSPKKYGKALTLTSKTPVSEILAAPQKFDGKRVLVEGAVVNVCESRGCWIELASDKEFESIIFKVEDGVITFPMSAKGKNAQAEGVIKVTTLSKEERIARGKKMAAENKTAFDPTTITGPQTTVRLMGEGAVIQ